MGAGKRREAFAWCLAIAGTLGTMAVLKVLVFVAVGPEAGAGLGNPSGHTAAGIVVYAGLLALLGERFAPRLNIALLAGPAFGLLFGLTRIELQVHTLADVLVGGAVGLGGVLVLAGWPGRAEPMRGRPACRSSPRSRWARYWPSMGTG